MKQRILILLLATIFWNSAFAQQTNSQNYIISRTFKQAGANVDDVSKVVTQVRYIDGLGRPLQNVTVGQSPGGTDIVVPVAYDALGRETKQYLPFVASGGGGYQIGALVNSATNPNVFKFYMDNSAGLQAGTTAADDLDRPFAETVFESSPLNRLSSRQGPGTRSRSSSIEYRVNTASEVKQYDYNPGTNTITTSGNYGAGKLKRTTFKDEQGFETNEYSDLLGQIVCKSVLTGTQTLFTYYIYDDMGLLRGVLQPNFQDEASFSNSAFLFDYDQRGRMVRKQVPGGGSTEYVYDKFDHLVLSRDANQAARNVWAFTKYDELNRSVMTGELASNKLRTQWQAKYDAVTTHHENKQGTTGLGYTLNLTSVAVEAGFPQIADSDVFAVTYYDDYGFPKPSSYAYSSSTGYPASENTAVKSLVTGGRLRVLQGNSATAGGWLVNVVYYDTEYRPIQTVRDLHDLGSDANERISTKYKYDLAPVVAEQKTVQVVGGATYSHIAENSYDHADRLLRVKETVTNEKLPPASRTKIAYTLAQRYNTLGQLQSKWFHGYANKEFKYRTRTDYTNNILGWVTDAKTWYQHILGPDLPFYAFSLSYNHVADAAKYSNGNISKMEWAGKDEGAFSGGLSFTYDNANRLLSAIKPTTATYTYVDTESGMTYDKNGNIKKLTRGGAVVDDLTYTYSAVPGNRLKTISDASSSSTGVRTGTLGDYGYDANGNMTYDANRQATLTYNYLNLPKTVAVGGKTLVYDYDAAGTKHKYVADTLTAKYAGRFEYRLVGTENNLVRVATSEGQVVPSGDTLRFDYFLKDHLGNVRVVWNELGEVIQETGYYPFGLEVDRNSPATTPAARNAVNRYMFLGREKQPETGYMDLMKRFYDPTIGRFMQVDPVTDTQEDQSVYQYGWNNPILLSDPNGDCPRCPRGQYLKAITNPITIRNLKYATENQKNIGSIKLGVGFGEGYGIRAFGREAKVDAFLGYNEVKIGSAGVSWEANVAKVSAGVELGPVKPGMEVKLGNVNIDFATEDGNTNFFDGNIGISREGKGSSAGLNNNGDSDVSLSAGPVSVGASGSLEAVRNTLTGYIKAIGGYVQAMTTEITNNTFRTDPNGRSTEQFIREEREPKR